MGWQSLEPRVVAGERLLGTGLVWRRLRLSLPGHTAGAFSPASTQCGFCSPDGCFQEPTLGHPWDTAVEGPPGSVQWRGGDAGAAAVSADGVRLERAGVPGGSSEMVRGNGQASGRKPAQPRGTARRRVGFLRQCWWLEKRLADTATWQSLVTLVRAVWGFRVVQEGLEGGGVKRTIADNSAGAFHCTWGRCSRWKWN